MFSGNAAQGNPMEMFIMLGMFGLVFYFMLYRPQAKRAKDHKSLMSSLSTGDEVLTNGGLLGRIHKVSDDKDYVVLTLNDELNITLKKDFITAVVPKGSMKSLA
jgi:preprotein translocase subunit YajC